MDPGGAKAAPAVADWTHSPVRHTQSRATRTSRTGRGLVYAL